MFLPYGAMAFATKPLSDAEHEEPERRIAADGCPYTMKQEGARSSTTMLATEHEHAETPGIAIDTGVTQDLANVSSCSDEARTLHITARNHDPKRDPYGIHWKAKFISAAEQPMSSEPTRPGDDAVEQHLVASSSRDPAPSPMTLVPVTELVTLPRLTQIQHTRSNLATEHTMIASGLPDAATTSGASGGVATKQDMFVRPDERRPVTQKEPKIGGQELRIQSTISQTRFDALQKQIAVSDNESIAGQVSSDSDEVPMFLQSENNYCVTLEHALGTHDKLPIFDRLVFRTRQDDHSNPRPGRAKQEIQN